MKREYKDYLSDILDAIIKIEQFIKRQSFEKFQEDDKTIFAVIRALEVIGEAANKIPAAERTKFKKIPWTQVAGMRNKLIHEYFGVDIQVVWKTIKEDIPSLKPFIKQMLKKI